MSDISEGQTSRKGRRVLGEFRVRKNDKIHHALCAKMKTEHLFHLYNKSRKTHCVQQKLIAEQEIRIDF